jgi:hypothetical protein
MICVTVGAFALPALLVYFLLLSQRAVTVDQVQSLIRTHRPDLFRWPEIVAVVVLVLLRWGYYRKSLTLKEGLFIASLALAIVTVFNQQVFTGRSLQPAHYEWFIANYCAGVASVLLLALWHDRSGRRLVPGKAWAVLALLGLGWGAGEVWLATSLGFEHNRALDEARGISKRFDELSRNSTPGKDPLPVVLISELRLADRFPTDAPQPVLWAPRMLVFPGVSELENQDRFFKQLYYLGFDEKKFYRELDRKDWNFYAGLFSYDRLSPAVSGSTQAISPDELKGKLNDFLAYSRTFSRTQATSPVLSYVLVRANDEPDYVNIDRWYERTGREQVGAFVLYQLKLRD